METGRLDGVAHSARRRLARTMDVWIRWATPQHRPGSVRGKRRVVPVLAAVVLAVSGLLTALFQWNDHDGERYELFGAAAVDVVTLDSMPMRADPALMRVQLGPRYFGARDTRVTRLVDQVPDTADLLIPVSAATRYLEVAETSTAVTLTGYSRCAPTECREGEPFEVSRDQVWLAAIPLADPLGERGVINGSSHAAIAAG